MNLWSVSILIEDKLKNLYSEYFEDFNGYLSSSIFLQEDNNQKQKKSISSKSLSIQNLNLGEFHENEFWVLEILFQDKPKIDFIKFKLNLLAKEFHSPGYNIVDYSLGNIVNPKTIKFKKVINKNWIVENRKSFPTINIDNFYIYGSHNLRINPVYKVPIRINASTAFGTGSHATTKCCLKGITYLSKFYKPKKILDYGCGTGILGIATKKIFKKSKIFLVDIDKNAVDLTKKNLKLNKIKSNNVYLTNSYFFREYITFKNYELVIANILYTPLYKLAPVFRYILKPKSKIILSGLLKYQIPYIINRFNNFGFYEEKKFFLDDWGSIIMNLKK